LLAVGRGEMSEDEVAGAIRQGERGEAGATAPAHGLTLKSVRYD
jgi:tRNA U38,U39,U40 pseudouridine synthase TruA